MDADERGQASDENVPEIGCSQVCVGDWRLRTHQRSLRATFTGAAWYRHCRNPGGFATDQLDDAKRHAGTNAGLAEFAEPDAAVRAERDVPAQRYPEGPVAGQSIPWRRSADGSLLRCAYQQRYAADESAIRG